jgi:uncharacterized membrane protein
MVQAPVSVLAVLLVVLALLFGAERTRAGGRVFRIIPSLVFAYFVPTILSNTGVIPLASPLYDFIRAWLLPASLILLTLSVDVPAIARLGRDAVVLFLAGTGSVILGGILAYLILGRMLPPDDQSWKGLAALSGSWIGGGANFVAVGESVGASDTTLSMMAVADVAIANMWMAVLLWFAGREAALDARIGADRSRIDEVRDKVQQFQQQVARATNVPDLFAILMLAFGGTVLAALAADRLPEIGDIVNRFTWIVVLVTALGLGLSFTRWRRLEGAGASRVGSVFLYLLIATIGAKAEFAKVFDRPWVLAVCALWMAIHAAIMLGVRRWLRAPIFFLAVGSQANIGGAASAPIVASAFHPALAPVGVLLAVGGYVLGTYGGILVALALERVHNLLHG